MVIITDDKCTLQQKSVREKKRISCSECDNMDSMKLNHTWNKSCHAHEVFVVYFSLHKKEFKLVSSLTAPQAFRILQWFMATTNMNQNNLVLNECSWENDKKCYISYCLWFWALYSFSFQICILFIRLMDMSSSIMHDVNDFYWCRVDYYRKHYYLYGHYMLTNH